jgi:hypothetical protein
VAIACQPFDTVPNCFMQVSMLSLPSFWMSSKFVSIILPLAARR